MQILRWLKKRTTREKELFEQKFKLKQEQSGLNMVDEFAKYSKIQRKINTIDANLDEITASRPTNSFFVQIAFVYGVQFVLVLLLIGFSLYFRLTPVIFLGKKVNLAPFTYLICYPNEVNYVSFYFWAMSSAAVARAFKFRS